MLTRLQDLDIQLLRLFITIAECGGFSAAQGKLGMAASTISTQMAKLETRLGFRLCERGKGGFRLTPKGERVLLATRRMLSALDTFTQEAQEVSEILLGEIHIGLSEMLDRQTLERMANTISRFRTRNQSVVLELVTAPPAELERRLLQDQLQLAIGYFSGQQTGLDYRPLFTERQVLYCGSRHPFFLNPPARFSDLASADKVIHPYKMSSSGPAFRTPRQTALSEQVDADLIFALSGAHITFLPQHIAQPWVDENKLHPLLEQELAYDLQFQLATPRGREPSEAVRAFISDLPPQL